MSDGQNVLKKRDYMTERIEKELEIARDSINREVIKSLSLKNCQVQEALRTPECN